MYLIANLEKSKVFVIQEFIVLKVNNKFTLVISIATYFLKWTKKFKVTQKWIVKFKNTNYDVFILYT